MAFKEINIGQLQGAQQVASGLLVAEANFSRRLYLTEALVLLAASHVLLDNENFNRPSVEELTNLGSSSMRKIIQRFEKAEIFQSDGKGGTNGRPHNLYRPTELGGRIMSIFQEPTTI